MRQDTSLHWVGKIIIVKRRLDSPLSTCFCIINCWKWRLVSFLGLKGGKILWIFWMKSFGGWHGKSLKNCWLINAFRSHRSINRWQTLNDSWLENINKTAERLHCSEVGAFYAQCLSKISWCRACTNQNTYSWIEEIRRKKPNHLPPTKSPDISLVLVLLFWSSFSNP